MSRPTGNGSPTTGICPETVLLWVSCCGSSDWSWPRAPPRPATTISASRTPKIFGNVGINGIRLTDLAAKAQLSLAATSDLVSDLENLGYLERRPDPSDRRAKLIFPTSRGRQALDDAGDRVAEIEEHWGELVGRAEFNNACMTLQRLLEAQPRAEGQHN